MKTRLLLSLSLLGLLFNTSCKKDDVEKSAYHLEISNTDGSELTEMSFDEDAASGTFKIQSDGIWEIIVPSDAQWISVSPASGKNDATVTVSVTANETTQTRTATVTIMLNNEKHSEFTITQKGLDPSVLNVTSYKTDFDNNGGTAVFDIESNTEWTYTVLPESDWITEQEKSDNRLVLTISEAEYEEREAKVIFSCPADSQISDTIDIKQSPKLRLEVSIQSDSFDYQGGTAVFDIESNTEWTYTVLPESDWITQQEKSDNRLTLTISEAEYEEREAKVIFSCIDDSQINDTIEIYQSPKLRLEVSIQSDKFDYQGGTAVFDIESNTEWTYTISPESDWITEQEKSDNRLTLTISEAGYEAREAEIIFVSTVNAELQTTIKISQQPQPAIVADLLDIVFNNDGTATDISPMGLAVKTVSSSAMMTYKNETYDRYVAHFNHELGSSVTSGYYRINFAGNQNFIGGLSDGHTLETLFMIEETPSGSKEIKMFSAMESGGTGFLIPTTANGKSITFLPNVNSTTTSKWIWTKSGIIPQPGVYYHVVGVWNQDEGKSYIYVNGELKGTATAVGNLILPKTPASTYHWFAIGGDAGSGLAQSAWKGDVAIARVYDAPLTAEQVQTLWEAAKADHPVKNISISNIQFLSGCEVGSGYKYTIYGTGFAAGDKIMLEGVENSSNSTVCDATITDQSATIAIPDGLISGKYRMMLLRGGLTYPLGVTELKYSDNPGAVKVPKIIAHRGVHTDGAAENSIAALVNAQNMGVYGSEFDVWITTDGKVVINHDATISGITIENSTYEAIQDLTLSNGEKLPTLDDYLEQALKNTETKLILEIKTHKTTTNNNRVTDAVIEAVKAKGLADRTEYIAFDYNVCKRIVAAMPDAIVGYLNGDKEPRTVFADGIKSIDYTYTTLFANPEWITQAHELGMIVNVWTVDNILNMTDCIAAGVDYITTNDCATLQTLIGKQFVAPAGN